MEPKLTALAQKLLLAIHRAGAQPGVRFHTDRGTLARLVNVVDLGSDGIAAALHELVRNGVSVKKADTLYVGPFLQEIDIHNDGSKISVIVGAPFGLIPPNDDAG